ncbi:MAG: leucine-rich repeat domain-containing protein [Oscillospiraceae bacterium]
MAGKKVKFPLDMGNDVLVRDIDELKENFNIEKVTEYFLNGKLLTWLNDRFYDEEAEQVEEISSETDKSMIAGKLCRIFEIESESDVDIEAIERRKERLEKLRGITSDDDVLANVDHVAFSQEELGDLLDEDVDVIYLCGEKFRIPLSVKDKKYIGVNMPVIEISSKEDSIDLIKYGIVVEKCTLSEKIQPQNIQPNINDDCERIVVEIKNRYIRADYDIYDIVFDEYDDDYDALEAFQEDTRPYKELNSEEVAEIIIEEGAKQIGACAFRGFKYLKKIMLPNSITLIKSCAFEYCESLESIDIPDDVHIIENDVFADCANLKNVELPKGLYAIECGVFAGCINLESIVFSKHIKTIPENTFLGCYKLYDIQFPDKLSEIKDHAFCQCKSLTSVDFPDELRKIGSWAFLGCESLKSVSMSDNVIEIGKNAFRGCKELERVKLSNKLEFIDLGWFDGCVKLSMVEIPEGVKKVKTSSRETAISSLTIPDSVPFNSFIFDFSKDCAIRELTLPETYKRFFAQFENDLPDECKINYYSVVFSEKKRYKSY